MRTYFAWSRHSNHFKFLICAHHSTLSVMYFQLLVVIIQINIFIMTYQADAWVPSTECGLSEKLIFFYRIQKLSAFTLQNIIIINQRRNITTSWWTGWHWHTEQVNEGVAFHTYTANVCIQIIATGIKQTLVPLLHKINAIMNEIQWSRFLFIATSLLLVKTPHAFICLSSNPVLGKWLRWHL